MTKPLNYKYHSTNQFRNVVKSVKEQSQFSGVDQEGKVIYDMLKPIPKLDYIGTVKLHGTNASIILHENGTISFHSKSNLLGYVREGEFTLLSDNAEFAQTMWRRFESVKDLMNSAKQIVKEFQGVELYPVKVSGEWCGSGIQKCVGISYLPKKSLFVFGIKGGETLQEVKQGWLPIDLTLKLNTDHENGIYSITEFPVKHVTIDFNNPEMSQNFLVESTDEVENSCPVSRILNLKDSEGNPTLLGEGLVWTPTNADHCWDSGNWFKTKGQKHSVSKVKSVASVDPEKLSNIQEFVEYSVTENRLEQGLSEVGLDQKLIGNFIGWVSKDINKEEGDVLEKNNLSMKDVGKYIVNTSRQWYIAKLNSQ
jgi:hypothetical protein